MKDKIIKAIATFFFVGYLPFMPGTWGSLAGAAVYFLVRHDSRLFAGVITAIFLLGLYSAGRAEEIFKKKDDERIVIDEVFGILLLFLFIPPHYPHLIAGFILFRVFDILKPYPIKDLQKLSRSMGVMLDDILAAAYAYLVISILGKFFPAKREFFLSLSVIDSSNRIRKEDSKAEDALLVQNAKGGDRAAFDVIYQKYKRPIFNYIYRMIGNRETAEELAQETFVKAYVNLPNYKERSTFSAWLYTIAGNLVKNELRANVYRAHLSLDQPLTIDEDSIKLIDAIVDRSDEPDLIAQSNEFQDAIQRVLNSLQLEHRAVLTLCDIQGLSYEEAARIMGVCTGTIASRLSRARAEFNKKLKIEYDLDRGIQ